MIQPDRMADDLGGKAMAVVRVGDGFMPSLSPASGRADRPGYRDNAGSGDDIGV
jgi:hypothetical protein